MLSDSIPSASASAIAARSKRSLLKGIRGLAVVSFSVAIFDLQE
jgi:hypothetical protein